METNLSPIIQLENITKKFSDGTVALDNISLNIYSKDFIVIGGSNGSGKSVLMSIIANLDKATSGKIINNAKEQNLNPHIALIFQDADAQILGDTPQEDIAFGLKQMNLSKEQIKNKTEEYLSYCELSQKCLSPARLLSGGEKRRLSVASILAMNSDIIIFDEPFANLDWPGVKLVIKVLKDLSQQNKTIIILTHETEKILGLANRFVILNKGKIEYDGTPQEALTQKDIWNNANIKYPLTTYSKLEDLIW